MGFFDFFKKQSKANVENQNLDRDLNSTEMDDHAKGDLDHDGTPDAEESQDTSSDDTGSDDFSGSDD